MDLNTKATIVKKIAELLFESDVRLTDESDLLAMDKANKTIKYDIVNFYRKTLDNQIINLVDWSRIPECNHDMFQWAYVCLFDDINNIFSDDVDQELWEMQCRLEPGKYKSELDYAIG